MGLPKPVIPEPVPQEAISEEFNQLNVQDDPKNETFDKDDESTQDEQIPEGTRIKTPTFNFRENVEYISCLCRKFSELRALVFLSSIQTSQNPKFIQKCPCLSSLKNKFQWTQKNN